MAKFRCIVRTRPDISGEVICTAINKTKVLSAQQIVKNERGEEVIIVNTKVCTCSKGSRE